MLDAVALLLRSLSNTKRIYVIGSVVWAIFYQPSNSVSESCHCCGPDGDWLPGKTITHVPYYDICVDSCNYGENSL